MKNSKNDPITLGPDDGLSVSVVGDTYRILVSGKQTNGSFATMEFLIPPNGGPGPHSHADFYETFYVADGEVEVKSEAGAYTAVKGSYVVIPKGGIIHDFKNKTDKTALLLCTVVPAGLEDFFLEVGKPIATGEFLPPPPMDPKSAEMMAAIAKKHGQIVYPPDYFG